LCGRPAPEIRNGTGREALVVAQGRGRAVHSALLPTRRFAQDRNLVCSGHVAFADGRILVVGGPVASNDGYGG
jgi:hypothetical protein